MGVLALIKKHSVLFYFVLTLLISWGSLLLIMGMGGILGTTQIPEERMPLLYIGMLLGPTTAGLVMTGLTQGRPGFRELFLRLRHWRVNIKWYLTAILVTPVLVTGVLFLMSQLSSGNASGYIPGFLTSNDKISLLVSGLMAGVMVGIFEELGWTGFAIPRLRLTRSVLVTGLIVGLVWGLWHMPLFIASARASQELAPLIKLLVLLFSFLPVYRVLMVWVYERTQSLLVAMIMHMGQTATTLVLAIPESDIPTVISNIVYSAFLWIIVAAVFILNHKRPVREQS